MNEEFLTEEDWQRIQAARVVDTTATAPRQPVEDPDEVEKSNELIREFKATALEAVPPIASTVATAPWLLGGGVPGLLGYLAFNGAVGFGSSILGQKFRNPEKDTSLKHATVNGVFSAIPGMAEMKGVSLGRKGMMALRAGEGAVMAGGFEAGTQLVDIYEGERPEGLDFFSIGFAGATGGVLGLGVNEYAYRNFRRANIPDDQIEKARKLMESQVADRINKIDDILKKNPELGDGEMGVVLMKERESLAERLTEVSRTDKEYLQSLRKQAEQKKEELEKEWAEIVATYKKQPEVGEGTVLRPAEEIAEKAPEKIEVKTPTKLTTEQRLKALERMQMSDEDLMQFIEGKTKVIPLNIGTITEEKDVQKTLAAVLEQVKDGFKKRGVKTDKASLLKRAAEIKSELHPETDTLKYVQNIEKKSEDLIFETVVADSLTLNAINNFNKKLNPETNWSDPAVLNDLRADFDRIVGFAESAGSIGSNTGKLLQSRKVDRSQLAAVFQQQRKEAEAAETALKREFIKYSKDLTPEQLSEQLDKLGGLKAAKAFADHLRVLTDSGKLSKLLEISSKTPMQKGMNMLNELSYDFILSGPVTQAAAFSGNVSMALYTLSNQALGGLLQRDFKTSAHAVETARNLLYASKDAWKSAMIAAKHSKGQMGLDTHFERVGGKAFSMEETGIKGVLGEGIENLGEMLSFGPKGLVFQDEFFRHMFAKSQVKALLSQEYKQLVKSGEVPIEGLSDYIEGNMARYFVDGKRYKTLSDVKAEAVEQAARQNLEGDEAVAFINKYEKDNWNNKLSSELEYLKEFGDRITFQQNLEQGHSWLETGGTFIQQARHAEGSGGALAQFLVPFVKTPVNIFKEFGGTLSATVSIPGVTDAPVIRGMWSRSREELMSDNPLVKAHARGRQVVGAGIWSSALYLAYNGITTGSGPRNYRERQNLKNQGWMENSINVTALERMWETGQSGGWQQGDELVSLQRLDPLATVTGVATDLIRANEYNDMPKEIIDYLSDTIMLAITQNVGQKSYLETVGSALEALTNGRAQEGGYGSALLESLARRATPSILNAIGRSDDPYMREKDGPLEVLYSRLPGFMQELDPYRNAFGEKVPQYGGVEYDKEGNRKVKNAMTRELNLFSPATISETWGDKATQALVEVGGSYQFPDPTRQFPGIDLRKIKVTNSNQSLYDRWKELYSQTGVKKAVERAFDNPFSNKVTRPRKGNGLKDYQRNAIKAEIEKYQGIALSKLLQEYPALFKQTKYNTELNMLQLKGEELPEETVAPELRELVK